MNIDKEKSFFRVGTARGFTLIELLIVVAILSIMAGVLFTSLNAGQATLAAQRSTQLIVETLREAQNNALGAKVAGSPPSIPPGGWGVYFVAGSNPILFADVNNNHQYDAGIDVLVRTILLDQNAPITGLNFGAPQAYLNIVFLPPNPNVYINGFLATPLTVDATATVTATVGNAVVKTVHVNNIGVISVQ